MKRIIKNILPHGIVSLYKSFMDKKNKDFVWNGVYSNFDSAPREGDGYNDTRLVQEISESAKTLKAPEIKEEHSYMPFLVSLLTERTKGRIRILDFGGAMGAGYLCLTSFFLNPENIDYHVIELESICEEGRTIFKERKNIHFHSSFPDELSDINIIYVNSALQYVEDFKEVLHKLCSYNAQYFLFVRLSAGNIPTFVSVQENLPGAKIPCRFFNIKEIITIMNNEGYNLIYKGLLERKYDMRNFIKKYRLEQQSVLLFSGKDNR